MDAINAHFGSQATGFSNPNAEPKPEVEEKDEVDPVHQTEPEEKKDPEKILTYAERLKVLKISDEEATEIIDSLCEEGSFIKAYTIRKKRENKPEIKAVFMTRDTRIQGFITEKVAKTSNNTPIIFNKLMGEMQLAGSLVHYNGINYKPLSEIEDDKEFEQAYMERVIALEKIPSPITVVFLKHLSAFDLTVAAVMAPGYEDFF